MALFGPADVGFVLLGGRDILGAMIEIQDSNEAIVEEITALGDSVDSWSKVGVNKGAVIQMCTPAQVSRWAKLTNQNFTSRTANPTSCKSVLCAKFGKSTIKAVARTKSGSFMVATSPVSNGKKFCFPK